MPADDKLPLPTTLSNIGKIAAAATSKGDEPAGSITGDPILDQLLGSLSPEEQAALNPGALGADLASQAQPPTLVEQLMGTAMDVTGRYGLTGRNATVMPGWARDLPSEVFKNPDFDSFFGVVSQQGDERVYFGDKQVKRQVPTGEFDINTGDLGDDAGTDFRSGGATPVTEEVTKTKDKTKTVAQAMNLPYTWEDEEIADAMDKMREAGMDVKGFDDVLSVWGSLVERAAMTYSMSEGKRKVTPWDVLDMQKSEAKAAGITILDPNRTESVVQRSVSDITEGQAWSTLQQTLSGMLGRDPSDQELRDYTYRMNQLAAANPSITNTIVKYKDGRAVSQTSDTQTGFTNDDMAQSAYEKAQDNPEYAEYQGATTYFNAAMSALGAIGQG
jgi:hypothetical protein